MDLITLIEKTATREELARLLRGTEEQRQTLERAIRWALGEADSDFGEQKPDNAKPYWWRAELRKRAGM